MPHGIESDATTIAMSLYGITKSVSPMIMGPIINTHNGTEPITREEEQQNISTTLFLLLITSLFFFKQMHNIQTQSSLTMK